MAYILSLSLLANFGLFILYLNFKKRSAKEALSILNRFNTFIISQLKMTPVVDLENVHSTLERLHDKLRLAKEASDYLESQNSARLAICATITAQTMIHIREINRRLPRHKAELDEMPSIESELNQVLNALRLVDDYIQSETQRIDLGTPEPVPLLEAISRIFSQSRLGFHRDGIDSSCAEASKINVEVNPHRLTQLLQTFADVSLNLDDDASIDIAIGMNSLDQRCQVRLKAVRRESAKISVPNASQFLELRIRIADLIAQELGGTFTVTASGLAEAEFNLSISPSASPQTIAVLAIDDRKIMLNLLRDRIERLGITLVGCLDLSAALDRISEQSFHLIILDMHLSESEDGLTNAEAIVNRLQSSGRVLPPIIAMSANEGTVPLDQLKARGVVEFHLKAELIESLEDILSRHIKLAGG